MYVYFVLDKLKLKMSKITFSFPNRVIFELKSMSRLNKFDQPIGKEIPNWKPCRLPEPITLIGRTCRLEPLNADKHTADLFAAYSQSDA